MSRIAIIKTGCTYPSVKASFGDFEDWFIAALGQGNELVVINAEQGESPGSVGDWDGVVVTGSPAMVTDLAPWSEATAVWLADAVAQHLPILGVCYGHQLLAHALGGKVGDHPDGRESGTYRIRVTGAAADDALFRDMGDSFPAQLTHRQSVLRLPAEAVLLASSDFEPHQAYRIGDCAWGVQFHPEFSAEAMRAYLTIQADALRAENQNPDALLAAVTETPLAGSLLEKFSALVAARNLH